ncbi:formate/nitrite transporter family protein [uncultured Clostridium sp.]|jgi:nitrite transporter NirC|uniref:formate/nitrite transporter family protein n=1 Tax=uncultured Clostridium sp. TaxID=59620 RepID=UPI002639728A|nr:formate/nitrite transporter family protein [uncultured Clostridium sp.]
MYKEEMDAICHSAEKKIGLYNKGILKYIIISLLGGLFVGLGVMLLYSVGGILDHADFGGTKIIMGVSFGVALSLVMMAGVDLFTSNSLVMTIGALYKKVSILDMLKILIASYIGNVIGSVIGAFVYVQSHAATSYVEEYIMHSAELKMNTGSMDLFFKGILCNILVCLAAWCTYKLKSESGKLIMIFWCLYTFITSGFEHSIANMSLFSMSLMMPAGEFAVSIGGAMHNLLWVSLGNFVGGAVFLALPLYYIAKETKSKSVSKEKEGHKVV